MKTFLLLAIGLAVVSLARAAHKRSVSKRMFAREGVSVSNLAREMNLGERCGFREGEAAKTAKGHNRQRLRQTFEGLDVVGATADVEMAGQGVLTGTVSGVLAYSLDSDIPDTNACRRETPELVQRAKTYLQERMHLTIGDDTPPKYTKAVRKIHFNGESGTAKLVYQLEFLVELVPTPCRPFFLMDACDPDLDVIIYFDKIHNMTLGLQRRQQEECDTTTTTTTTTQAPSGTCPSTTPAQGVGGNPKTGRITYGVDRPFCLLTEVTTGRCTMDSKYARVIDLENTRSDSGRTPVEFDCAEGYSDPINEAYGVANDAFYYGYSTGQLYEDWYGFYALGYAPKLKVHYSNCYENAFWNGRDMTFGDGCNYLYPLVSQDVIAHELGHGITDRYSDLYYSEQSGGINEAFSDMSGEVAELFSTNTNDWQVGRELFKGNSALRYFERPSRDGRSIDSANDYRSGLDVHYSSGVFNRAYFQLVNTQGVPLRQAYEIFLQANRVIWNENTNFQEGACGAMKAAYDLGYNVNKVKAAFAVVDIDLTNCDYTSFQQSIASGEARVDVMVSSLRNPVFALDVPAGVTALIDVATQGDQVTVSVTSDAAGENVVASGVTPFVFDVTADSAYFKISTSNGKDSSVSVSVDVMN